MELFIGLWLLCGILAAVVGGAKGRSGCGWFIVGVLAGPLGLLAVVGMPVVPRAESVDASAFRKCPDCAETIMREARLCKHCGHRLTDVEIREAEAREAAAAERRSRQTVIKMGLLLALIVVVSIASN